MIIKNIYLNRSGELEEELAFPYLKKMGDTYTLNAHLLLRRFAPNILAKAGCAKLY